MNEDIEFFKHYINTNIKYAERNDFEKLIHGFELLHMDDSVKIYSGIKEAIHGGLFSLQTIAKKSQEEKNYSTAIELYRKALNMEIHIKKYFSNYWIDLYGIPQITDGISRRRGGIAQAQSAVQRMPRLLGGLGHFLDRDRWVLGLGGHGSCIHDGQILGDPCWIEVCWVGEFIDLFQPGALATASTQQQESVLGGGLLRHAF